MSLIIWVLTLGLPSTPCFSLLTSSKAKRQFNSYKRYYYMLVMILNFANFLYTLKKTDGCDFDDVFLAVIRGAAFLIRKVDDVLTTFLFVVCIFVTWKLKDRLLVAVGIDYSSQLLGDYRDWLTCWGMTRFEPLQIYLWKIEGLSQGGDIFLTMNMGYNMNHRTCVRSHHGNRAGSYTIDLRETLQLNFDPHDLTELLTIEARQQNIYRSQLVSSVKIGGGQLVKMVEEERRGAGQNPLLNPQFQTMTTGVISHATKLLFNDPDESVWKKVNMIPNGVLYLRVLPFKDTVAGMDL